MISDNQTGISVTGGLGTLIEGNYIGPDPTGESSFAGSGTGIAVDGSNVTIGGTSPGSGNVISGLFQDAIALGNTTGDVVKGNIIGLSASQATGLGVDTAVNLFGGAPTTRSAASAPVPT